MQGIIVTIPDHPTEGHKIEVEAKGYEFSWENESITVHTECRYYQNINGEKGPLVDNPTKIVFSRPLVADTKKDQFVDARTGAELKRMSRTVNEVEEEYWVLASDEATEVPLAYVQRMFMFFENIVRNVEAKNGDLLINYILAEIPRGTWYQVGK